MSKPITIRKCTAKMFLVQYDGLTISTGRSEDEAVENAHRKLEEMKKALESYGATVVK